MQQQRFSPKYPTICHICVSTTGQPVERKKKSLSLVLASFVRDQHESREVAFYTIFSEYSFRYDLEKCEKLEGSYPREEKRNLKEEKEIERAFELEKLTITNAAETFSEQSRKVNNTRIPKRKPIDRVKVVSPRKRVFGINPQKEQNRKYGKILRSKELECMESIEWTTLPACYICLHRKAAEIKQYVDQHHNSAQEFYLQIKSTSFFIPSVTLQKEEVLKPFFVVATLCHSTPETSPSSHGITNLDDPQGLIGVYHASFLQQFPRLLRNHQ
ncbi:hypothetical protein CEXT_230681 [Caerostris extrusa]|uniref:Uncharacterized protein n=1 Tax=Caerostris extrusa TaxID=172846 RepID=A0AAV4XKA5_CAEEX|nr:hypothetical protein CEXT_230681 [Caerostris extrusa]